MKIVASMGREDVAIVYIAEFDGGKLLECVESLSPPQPREKKWVLLVSTMYGCPVGCQMCDAGGVYNGKASVEEIFAQLDYMVYKRFPEGIIPSAQFKIQFARMGEPSLNPHVLTVLNELPARYHAPGLMPSISTIAPRGSEPFFDQLLEIKQENYSRGQFQFQFSIHTTDEKLRDQIIPVKKWGFPQMAEYGSRFHTDGDRKITLNFALFENAPVDPGVLLNHFDPDLFLIKITPLNPTYRATKNELISYIKPEQTSGQYRIIEALRRAGYGVILSIGELEENKIGSNCGQYIQRHLESSEGLSDGYTYQLQPVVLGEGE
jgi:23S rRNA (adenine2503-C2)-methyltransferase